MSRDYCALIPRPWQRYLRLFKALDDSSVVNQASPSLAQRSFSNVLDQIGTQAADVRDVKPGEGRQQGDSQEKRANKPIVFKSKKSTSTNNNKKDKQNQSSVDLQGFEKLLDQLKPQKIDALVGILKSWLPTIGISKADLLILLAKELQA